MTTTTTTAVFAAAATATAWTRTNLGPHTEVRHAGYVWTVALPASGHGKARITGCHGYGGTEFLDIEATWAQTIGIVEAAQSAITVWQATTDGTPLPHPPTTRTAAQAHIEGLIRPGRSCGITVAWRCGSCDRYYTCPDCEADRPVPLHASWWQSDLGESDFSETTRYAVEPVGSAAV